MHRSVELTINTPTSVSRTTIKHNDGKHNIYIIYLIFEIPQLLFLLNFKVCVDRDKIKIWKTDKLKINIILRNMENLLLKLSQKESILQ